MSNAATEEKETIEDEVMQRGIALYDTRLKAELERDHLGKVVAIHTDSSEYAIGADSGEAVRLLRQQHSKGLLFVRRIGPPTSGDRRFAARFTAAEMKKK